MKRTKLGLIAAVLIFVLFFCFAGASIVAVELGNRAASATETASELSFNARLLPAFIAEKLRESDGYVIHTGRFHGLSALFVESAIEDVSYTDIIYAYEGNLCELFCEKGSDFLPGDGPALLAVHTLEFTEPKTGLIRIDAEDALGHVLSFHIYIRSGGRV